jgi:hypothetical protein
LLGAIFKRLMVDCQASAAPAITDVDAATGTFDGARDTRCGQRAA